MCLASTSAGASPPSVGKTLIENNGMAFYVIDEAHTLFDSIYSSRAPSYKQELDSELLSCYTSKRKLFSIVDVKGIKEDCDKEEKRIKNNINDESIGKPEGDKLLKLIEARKDLVSKGVENPFFGMCTYSTPSNMEKVFRAETIESGLIGRTIFVRGSDDCPPMNFDMTTELVVDSKVVSKLSNIKQFCRGRVQFIDADAAKYAVHVGKVIDKYRNEPQVGEIIRRLWELSMKVASILAIGDTGKITRLHITWAVYMLLESLTDTWATFRVNDSQGDDGMVARWSELVARITKILGTTSQKDPMLASVIKARVFKTKGNRILKLCEAAYAADVEYGKGEFVRMALTEMLTAGVLDKDGNKWWIFHPENQAAIKVSAEFANIYNNVGRFSAFMR